MNSEELKETVEVIKEQNGHSNGAGQDSKNAIEIDGGAFQWEASQVCKRAGLEGRQLLKFM